MTKWLDIIGIGEDGIAGLSQNAIKKLEAADVIIGGDRHHKLTPDVNAKRLSWPSPFDAMIEEINRHKGKNLVILVTGDPLWYSVGARILRSIPAEQIEFHPQLSAFQWASARMGWSLADCETLTVHGRPHQQIVPSFAPGVRMLVLTKNRTTPGDVARLLVDHGFGRSPMTVLAALGGNSEERIEGIAEDWNHDVPDFHTLAIECVAGSDADNFFTAAGLDDDAYIHDGQMTKRVVRAATLSALRPYPDALLWDIGAGCGSVSIEWMRAARGAQAIGIEANKDRIAMMEKNAVYLGTPRLQIIEGKAPQVLEGLATPDAIFIGGGLTSEGVFETCFEKLRHGGRLVANVVTLESEARLLELSNRYGGSLERISVSQAISVGRFSGMKPSMSVMQWCVVKPFEQEGSA